jgi:hypothetical protein
VGAVVGHPVKPPLHVKLHRLLTQLGCELATVLGQALPHPLQSFALLVVSTQVPPHRVGVPVGQPVTHVPVAQTGSVEGHMLVHVPQ